MVEAGVPVRPDTLPVLRKNIAAWAAFGPTERELAPLTDRLLSQFRLLEPDELWIPMGLGPHSDHVRTRQACLNALQRSPRQFRGTRVFLYEDLPYARQFPHHADNVAGALKRARAELVPVTEDITDVFDEKMDVLSVYASQWRAENLRTILSAGAPRGGINHPHETYREMIRAPEYVPSVSALSFDQPFRAHFAARLRDWLLDFQAGQRLTVLLVFPMGRWDMALDCLANTFAGKEVCVYTLSDLIPPADLAPYPDITVNVVPTTDHLTSILKECDQAGEWTLALDGEKLLKPGRCSKRCFWAPYFGLISMLIREAQEAGRLLVSDDPAQAEHV